MGVSRIKTWMMATGLYIAQWPLDSDDEGLAARWASTIDATDVVRRRGETVVKRGDRVVELHSHVEYGPIKAIEGDMHRHLERQLASVQVQLAATAVAVFDVSVTHLETDDQFREVVTNLESRANDINVPLSARKQLAAVVMRLRSGRNAGRVRRVAALSAPAPRGIEDLREGHQQ